MLSRRLGTGWLGSWEKAGPETLHPGARKEGEGTEDSDLKGEPRSPERSAAKGAQAPPEATPCTPTSYSVSLPPLLPTPQRASIERREPVTGTRGERHTSRHVTETHTQKHHTLGMYTHTHTPLTCRHTPRHIQSSRLPCRPKKWPGDITGLSQLVSKAQRPFPPLPGPPAGKDAPFSPLGPVTLPAIALPAFPPHFKPLCPSLHACPPSSHLYLPLPFSWTSPPPAPSTPQPLSSTLFLSLPPFISPFVPEET